MKTIFSILFVALMTFTFAQSTDVLIDPQESSIEWTGKKITGKHTGTIELDQASLDYKNGVLNGGVFTLNMKSIKCTDLDGATGDKLIGHLKNEDFFNVSKFPLAKITFTSVKQVEPATYAIVADLEVKGISNPIEFTAVVDDWEATTVIQIDRTKYDIKYGSASFFDSLGDRAIDNIFEVAIRLVFFN